MGSVGHPGQKVGRAGLHHLFDLLDDLVADAGEVVAPVPADVDEVRPAGVDVGSACRRML